MIKWLREKINFWLFLLRVPRWWNDIKFDKINSLKQIFFIKSNEYWELFNKNQMLCFEYILIILLEEIRLVYLVCFCQRGFFLQVLLEKDLGKCFNEIFSRRLNTSNFFLLNLFSLKFLGTFSRNSYALPKVPEKL